MIGRAAAAGAVGTLAVAALGPLERRALGRAPVFAPERLARRLARTYLGRALRGRPARRAGLALRWTYGPTWGAALLLAPAQARRAPLAAGLALGAAVAAFEEVALPATGATPRRWTRREHALLAAQTLAFGVAAGWAFAALAPR